METAVVQPALVAHVTGYPSLWWGRQRLCASMSHTFVCTRPHLPHLETSPQRRPQLRANVAEDHAAMLELCRGPRDPPSPLHRRGSGYVSASEVTRPEENNPIIIWTCSLLFCFRFWIFPDLQREPQQVHTGGEWHLGNGGPLRPSLQRSAVSLGFRIARPEPQAPAVSGSHRHQRLGEGRPLWMRWKQPAAALGVQERYPLWSEGPGTVPKLGQ